MNLLILRLFCCIFSEEKQIGRFEYWSSLSNNRIYEREGCKYFLKDLNKRIQELYVANPRKTRIKTSELIIFGVTSNVISSFIKNELPSLTKDTNNEYQCSYIKCLKMKQEFNNSNITMLGSIIDHNINENKSFYGEYEFENFVHNFMCRNEKINGTTFLDIEKSINTESKIEYDNRKKLESDELMTCPDFFMINDGKADAEDLYSIKNNFKTILNRQIFKPAKLFEDFFRNFYENEHYLFQSITYDLFYRKLFLKHEFSSEIFDLKYDDMKAKIFENFYINRTVVDSQDHSHHAYLEYIFSKKEIFNRIFEKYIKEQDWNDYLDKLRLAQKVIDHDINYIIILSGSDLGDKVKKCLYKTLYDKINIDLLLEIDFFLCEVVGEIKKDNDSVALLNLKDSKINTSENLNKIEDKVDNKISIKWKEFEIKENDRAEAYNEYTVLGKYRDRLFLGMECKILRLKIYFDCANLKFCLQHKKIKKEISYFFEVGEDSMNFNEFFLLGETFNCIKRKMSDLDAKTYILSIIKNFFNENLDMIFTIHEWHGESTYKTILYDLDFQKIKIRTIEGITDFNNRELFYKAFFDNLNSLNIEGFQLEDNLMITDKGLVFNNYSLKETILKSTLEFFNENEVISLDRRQKIFDPNLKHNRFLDRPFSIFRKIGKNEYTIENESYMDTVLNFKREKSESNIKFIMRLECKENFEHNGLIKDIVKIYDVYNINLKRNYKNKVLCDFISDVSKKKVCTSFFCLSKKISKTLYDKKVDDSEKLNIIVGIICKWQYIHRFKCFVRDGKYKDFEIIDEAYKTIISDILPKSKKILIDKLQNILKKDSKKHEETSCVFEITLLKDDKLKSEDYEYLVSEISKWAKKIRF